MCFFSPTRKSSREMPEPSSKSAEYLASLMMGSGCDGDSLKANRTTQASVEPVCSPSSESHNRQLLSTALTVQAQPLLVWATVASIASVVAAISLALLIGARVPEATDIDEPISAPVPFVVAIIPEADGLYIEYRFVGLRTDGAVRATALCQRIVCHPSRAEYEHRAELQLHSPPLHSLPNATWLGLVRSHCLGANAINIEPALYPRVGDVRITGMHSIGSELACRLGL